MSKNIWVISDHHFNHKNIIKFLRDDGTRLRPEFNTIEEMNEFMVHQHNSVVQPGDKVYIGGDFGDLEFANRLIGQKRLILGNHDDNWMNLKGAFKKIQVWRQFREDDGLRFAITHIPILLGDGIEHRSIQFNVHGHLHHRIIMKDNKPDWRYINMCVEHHNYTPIHIEDLKKMMRQRMKLLT